MRTSAEALRSDAVAALVRAALRLDLSITPSGDDPGAVQLDVDGRSLRLDVHGATLLDGPRAETLVGRATTSGSVPLVVGDKILEAARSGLAAAGWSWLDRRGHLHLTASGTRIDVEIEPDPRSVPMRRPDAALAARGGQELAVALLLAPDDPPGVREVARATGFAPSTISRAGHELRAAGFVRADGRPVIPDLFWALAGHWAPDWVALERPVLPLDPALADPDLADLGANLHDLDQPGFAVGDTRGALAWGAPVVATSDAAPSIYVPDRLARDQVLERWGRAAGAATSAGRIAIGPVRSVTVPRFRRRGESWPVVHPLVVALDLATDRARGHQILDEWNPEDTTRVW